MTAFWLAALPSTNPAFAPLQRAGEIDPDEFPPLWEAHQRAVLDAAWGGELAVLDERAEDLRLFATHDCGPRDRAEAEVWRRDELEAIGYALGVTAVRVALREHREALAVSEVA